MKQTLILILGIIQFSSFGQKAECFDLEDFDFESAVVFQKKKNIPKKVIKDISQLIHQRFKLVDPNREFNRTDFGIGIKAQRRLVFTINLNNVWIIYYEHGGKSYSKDCVIYRFGDEFGGKACSLRIKEISSFEEFKKEVKEKKYEISSELDHL